MNKNIFSKSRNPKAEWNHDIKVAKELRYPLKAIALLQGEPDPNKRQRIMADARNGKYSDSRE